MSKPMRRTAAVIATAVLAVTLSACTTTHWVYDTPPAAGVQTDQDGIKLRNFVLIADDKGEGILVGGITARDEAAQVVGITVSAEQKDRTFAAPMKVDVSERIARGKTLILDGTATKVEGAQLVEGLLADVDVQFADGQAISLKVPVMPADHADFAETWKKSQA